MWQIYPKSFIIPCKKHHDVIQTITYHVMYLTKACGLAIGIPEMVKEFIGVVVYWEE